MGNDKPVERPVGADGSSAQCYEVTAPPLDRQDVAWARG